MAQQYLHQYERLRLRDPIRDDSLAKYSPSSGLALVNYGVLEQDGSGEVPA
jgi:hypothetical protein